MADDSAQHPFTPPAVAELQLSLPDYEIVDLIAVGGMAAVYRARHRSLDRPVAIKILPHAYGDDFGIRERFRVEAEAMAKLDHPGIVAIHASGETSGDPALAYIVMEFVGGGTLQEYLGTELPTDEIIRIISETCDVLEFAHNNGIIHRDIKPGNIMLTHEGKVKIADFGIAKILDLDEERTALTLTNMAMGTLGYIAPEQFESSRDVDHRADLFSLGVILYRMLTGELPKGSFVNPSEISNHDPRFDAITEKALQTDPNDRYQSAGDLRAMVRGETSQEEISPLKKPQPRKRKWLLPLTGTAVAVVAASAFLVSDPNPEYPGPPPIPEGFKAAPPVNLIERANVDEGSAPATGWSLSAGELENTSGASPLQIPFNTASAYRLEATVERLTPGDPNPFTLLLPAGEGRFAASFAAAAAGNTAAHTIDRSDIPPTSFEGPNFEPGHPAELTCTVLPGRVSMTFNGRLITEWNGDVNRMRPPESTSDTMNPRCLVVEGSAGSYRITRLEAIELQSKDSLEPVLPPGNADGIDLPEPIDLLSTITKMIDGSRWVGPNLEIGLNEQHGRIPIPAPLAVSYRFDLTLERLPHGENQAFSLFIPVGETHTTLSIDSGETGRSGIWSKDTSFAEKGPRLELGKPAHVILHVVPDGIHCEFEDEPLFVWKGDITSLDFPDYLEDRKTNLAPHRPTIKINESAFRISRFDYRPLDPGIRLASLPVPNAPNKSTPRPQPPTAKAEPQREPADLLAAIDRDKTDWKWEGDTLVLEGPPSKSHRVPLPGSLMPEFHLDIEVERLDPDNPEGFAFYLPVGESHIVITFDDRKGQTGIYSREERFLNQDFNLQVDHRTRITGSVRRDHIRFDVDGKQAIDWRGDITTLDAPAYVDKLDRPLNPGQISLQAKLAPFRITRFHYTPILEEEKAK